MGTPVWGVSAMAGLICALLGVRLSAGGWLAPGLVLIAGAAFLFAWALWLARERR